MIATLPAKVMLRCAEFAVILDNSQCPLSESVMKVIASLALAVCSALPLTASAGVINFQDIAHDTDFEFGSVSSGGYLVTHGGLVNAFAVVMGNIGQGATDFSGNGSHRLLAFNASTITISRPGDALFDLRQFDGGESWLATPHVWARQIQVVGQLAAGGTIAQTFTLDLTKDALAGMQQFILGDGFRDLLSVTFSGLGATGGGPEFSLDNLLVEQEAVALDAPPALWLACAGMAALAAMRRRPISSAAAAR